MPAPCGAAVSPGGPPGRPRPPPFAKRPPGPAVRWVCCRAGRALGGASGGPGGRLFCHAGVSLGP
eukprot:4800402-Lingulodinium_polyedra.AAC.1